MMMSEDQLLRQEALRLANMANMDIPETIRRAHAFYAFLSEAANEPTPLKVAA